MALLRVVSPAPRKPSRRGTKDMCVGWVTDGTIGWTGRRMDGGAGEWETLNGGTWVTGVWVDR